MAAIYPIESPGGYQLYGRTLAPWQTWGKGRDFSLESPWLLRPFDQVGLGGADRDAWVLMSRNRSLTRLSTKMSTRRLDI